MRFWRRHRPARAVKPAYPTRPRLEGLEDRCVPSIDMVTNLSGSDSVSGSLPFMVAHALPGDTILFAANLNGGTIILDNTLDINTNLTIEGAGSAITVNGGGNRVFLIEAGHSVNIDALTITGGVAPTSGVGGGIFNYGSLSLTDSTVTANHAAFGAGIFNATAATMTMSGDTVNNNATTGGTGGGILNEGTLTITDSTIAANVAHRGGGIANDGVLKIGNSTVASNTVTGAGADGGGIFTFGAGSQLDLLDTIVFNPNSGAATSNDVFGTVTVAQGDLFGSAVSIVSDVGLNQENVAPLLGPLQNNGGPTATMLLLANSPVGIDQGAVISGIPGLSATYYDQRAYARPYNSMDVGAVQTQTQVVADFVGQGVQVYTPGGWQALSPVAAQSVAVDGRGEVFAVRAGAGLWEWAPAAGWTQIDTYTPQSIAVDGYGDVAAAFAGGGLWTLTRGSWGQIDNYTPQSIAVDSGGDVLAAFTGDGLWRWDGTTWTQIDSFTPQSIAADDAGNVVATFTGGGLWRWTLAGGWTQIDGITPQNIAMDAAGDVFASFAGNGLWRWTLTGGWTQIDSITPQRIAADADGDVVAAFAGGTLWRWLPGSSWTKLMASTADALGACQF
jgi:hypothetical protein